MHFCSELLVTNNFFKLFLEMSNREFTSLRSSYMEKYKKWRNSFHWFLCAEHLSILSPSFSEIPRPGVFTSGISCVSLNGYRIGRLLPAAIVATRFRSLLRPGCLHSQRHRRNYRLLLLRPFPSRRSAIHEDCSNY